jgi:quercetin dioxygenase-like cupin family protein
MISEKSLLADFTHQNHSIDKGIHNNTLEIEKSKEHIIIEIVEYKPNAILSKTIINKSTGNVTVTSFDIGIGLSEFTSPFDIFIQAIDGAAEVFIEDKKYILRAGNGIVIPAHASHCMNANEQFKMISTVIKSGYED